MLQASPKFFYKFSLNKRSNGSCLFDFLPEAIFDFRVFKKYSKTDHRRVLVANSKLKTTEAFSSNHFLPPYNSSVQNKCLKIVCFNLFQFEISNQHNF